MKARLPSPSCGSGYAVDVATNGPGGLWQAREFDYDAIVLDVMLPGTDGFEVCRRLRSPAAGRPS